MNAVGRRALIAATVLGLLVTAGPGAAGARPGSGSQAPGGRGGDRSEPTQAVIDGTAPVPAAVGANPWLALLTPDQRERVDWDYWRALAGARAKARVDGDPLTALRAAGAPVVRDGDATGRGDQPTQVPTVMGPTGAAEARVVGQLAAAADVDVYAVDLVAGDVFSAVVTGSASHLALFAPDGTEVMGSSDDASFIHPAASPLLGGGNAALDHVAATAGQYLLEVTSGTGSYGGGTRVDRPGFEARAGAVQTIFLDFNGATVRPSLFGGPNGQRRLSPLSSFLSRWGLSSSDEAALVARVVASVQENLSLASVNPGIELRILNSRDDADPFGQTDVSRVIVGGTISQLGISTIGIAESIDPGNFGAQETAVVLLDVLSNPAGSAGDPSLNTYLRSSSNRVDFIGRALGNVIAHEIGHYIGNYHVDQANTTANIMDQGGNFPLMFGIGPDGIGGTADDPDVDFGADTFNPSEGFTGTENTAVRSGYGLS